MGVLAPTVVSNLASYKNPESIKRDA